MNKLIVSISCVLVVIVAMIVGVMIYIPKNKVKEPIIYKEIAEEKILDECTDEYEEMTNEVLETASSEEKIAPNASLRLNITYKNCGHTSSEYLEIPAEFVNLTKEELLEKYNEWKVEKFSDTDIILSKTEEGNCKEHFVVKEKDGKVVIYEVLEDGKEKVYEETYISTEYLTEDDKINIEKGIKVNGKQNLNQLIEDFE